MLFRVKVITDVAQEPVSVTEVKSQMRVTQSGEDLYINNLIQAARTYVEKLTRRTLAKKTLEGLSDNRPMGKFFHLPMPPVISITSIRTFDQNDVATVFPSSSYTLDPYGDANDRVYLNQTLSWPSNLRDFNSFEVRWEAGYSDALAIPEPLKRAINMIVSRWYEDRDPLSRKDSEGVSEKIIDSFVLNLIAPYIIYKNVTL